MHRDGIARVVRNLVDNAANHCESTVTAALITDGGSWQLVVTDDGPGIAPEDRAAVFERFARLDQSRSRNTGGTGLGLAIVASTVAEHGGTISISTADEGGAAFTVRIPIV